MKASAKKGYTARFEKGEKHWVVNIVELPGCHTQARTIAQGKERIREALSLYIGDLAQTIEIEIDAALPSSVRKAVERSLKGRQRATDAEAEAAEATERAVKAMLEVGLSTRDAGELLGLTRQRVHQLASGE